MKKTIGALALALGIGLSLGCAKQNTSQRLEQRISRQEIFDFNETERDLIRVGVNLVKDYGYEVPNIVFLRKKDRPQIINQKDSGEYCGLCKESKSKLPGYFNFKKFGDYHLIYLEGMYTHKRDSSEDWDSKFPHPLTSTTIHEIAHIYYSHLSKKEKQEIADFLTRIDLSLVENVPGNSHPGHASNYSYNNYLIRLGMNKEEIEKAAEEQAVEFFTRKISGLRNRDLKARIKSLHLMPYMQRFKRQDFFTVK